MRIKSVQFQFGRMIGRGNRKNWSNKQVFYRGDTVDPGKYLTAIGPQVKRAGRSWAPKPTHRKK